MQKLTILMLLSLLAGPAIAHHPLAGLPVTTFTHGLMSGFGHPILGFDHLFFVMSVGIIAIFTRHRILAPLVYIATMLGGCLFTTLWTTLPATELMIALSLLVLGSMLLSGHRFGLSTVMFVFASFGIFHGAAFVQSLAMQEAAFGIQVLTGYLLGLGVTQFAIALAAGLVCTMLWNVSQASSIQPRLAGAMVAGVGLYLTLEHFEGPLIRAISS